MKKLLILLFTVAILLTSCVPRPEVKPIIDYRTGTQGVELNFMQNYPPDEVSVGSEFGIIIELRNKGAASVERGRITIGGVDEEYIMFINDINNLYFDLDARSPIVPEGGYQVISIRAKSIALPPGMKEYSDIITATANYDYKTILITEACINPHIFEFGKAGALCELRESAFQGQGAPIAIKKIEPSIALKNGRLSLNYKIHIENVGDGTAENIMIERALLSTSELDCEGKSYSFKAGKATIKCSTEIPNRGEVYTAPLQINIKYEYRKSIDKPIKIIS